MKPLTLFISSIIVLSVPSATVLSACDMEILNVPSYSVNSRVFGKSLRDDCDCDSAKRTCVRKCCAENYILRNGTACVFKNDESFSVPVYGSYDTNRMNVPPATYSIVTGIMRCAGKNGYYRLEPEDYIEDSFYFQGNGKLWLKKNDRFVYNDQFCLENFDDIGLSALVCLPRGARLGRSINALGMMISMPFLLTTFIVYLFLPEKNVHGHALMFYAITLFGAYAILVSVQVSSKRLDDAPCKTLAIFCLFFFLVSFFWINVMSIDIWWTFSGMRGFGGNKKLSERKRLFYYSGYAFGVPLLHALLVLLLTETGSPDAWYYPGIGDGQCWFYEGVATLLYFYGPIALLIVINFALFVKTALEIKKVQNDATILRRNVNNKKDYAESEQQRFKLYVKLFLAMGINWSMEIISWAIEWRVEQAPIYIWYVTDFCNALYGMFIFFIFVFKRSVWILLQKRYYMIVGKARTIKSTTTTTTPRTTEMELSAP